MPTKKSLFVSGSAQGIGKAIVEKFASEGWFVGVYDIDAELARDVAQSIASGSASAGILGSDNAVGGALDVTDPASWNAALEEFATAAGGRLDLLVNNAGILRAGRLADVDLAQHHQTIEINVNGVINGCHTAYPYLRATPGSGVINVCSASAIYGQPEIASYSASKYAVRGLTEALELEWRKEGIRVQAVWPLWVKTALLDGNAASSHETLGIRLTVEDVADQVWEMAQPRKGLRGRLPKVHTTVGLPARALSTAADLAPNLFVREVNRFITRA
ncbi:SDR family oxidoreductase [Nocardioides sp. NPDC101246]|uniref:SDR family oxidoreductase n=1 Tax=Nocardioides sp. NPDC101246 TaxID=3364336 RepID=UPI0037FEAA37